MSSFGIKTPARLGFFFSGVFSFFCFLREAGAFLFCAFPFFGGGDFPCVCLPFLPFRGEGVAELLELRVRFAGGASSSSSLVSVVEKKNYC